MLVAVTDRHGGKPKNKSHFRTEEHLTNITMTTNETTMPGGYTGEQAGTPDVQAIVDKVKTNLQDKTGKTYNTFEAVKYRSQVVAGVNYLVKVKVGDNSYVHVKIFDPLPSDDSTTQLVAYAEDKTVDDPLDVDI